MPDSRQRSGPAPRLAPGPGGARRLARKDRLVALIAMLRDGRLHRAADLAAALQITPRTLYRDMDTLRRSGVPVAGQRGRGYRMSAPVTLPALNLDMAELEALHLGLAVMSQAEDPPLRAAARRLAARIDAALPEGAPPQIAPPQAPGPQTAGPEPPPAEAPAPRIAAPENAAWGLALHPFADPAAGIRHMPALRAALRNRRALRLVYRDDAGARRDCIARPLGLDFWGRVWTCTLLCEGDRAEKTIRLDRIESLAPIA